MRLVVWYTHMISAIMRNKFISESSSRNGGTIGAGVSVKAITRPEAVA
jgi:hypothetical protein